MSNGFSFMKLFGALFIFLKKQTGLFYRGVGLFYKRISSLTKSKECSARGSRFWFMNADCGRALP